MSDSEAVLWANETFYQAFAAGDFPAMDALWSVDRPVSCIHPGWEALPDRRRVMESWRMILTGESAAIECRDPHPFVQGSFAWVTCSEVLATNLLAATNIFALEAAGWRMVHHHASPVAQAVRPSGPTGPVH